MTYEADSAQAGQQSTSQESLGLTQVREERVDLAGIPTRIYQPGNSTGLLLLGHGGGGSKDDETMVALGRQYAMGTGLTAVCIDVIGHGERSGESMVPRRPAFLDWIVAQTDLTMRDWISAAAALAHIGPPVACVGFSMGAMFCAATAAQLGIEALVLGCGGLPAGLSNPAPVLGVASQLGDCEVLMLSMIKDATFPLEETLRFFNTIPGRRKRIAFWEGDHYGLLPRLDGDRNGLPPEAIRVSVEFLQHEVCQPG